MSVAWNERMIGRMLARQFFSRKYLVMVPNCNWTGYECDVLAVTESLKLIDIEIKVSRQDLRADAKKDKWWLRHFGAYNPKTGRQENPPPTALQWPRHVWKHYYCLPKEIWDDSLMEFLPSNKSGVILLKHGNHNVPVVYELRRKATPCREAKAISAEAAVNLARLASLRMWDAYLEVEKLKAGAA